MATRKTTKNESIENIDISTEMNQPVRETKTTTTKKETKKRITRIPLDTEFPCTNNTRGELIYKSTRQGGLNVTWDGYEAVQYLDLRELMQMRNSAKRFFDDNWIIIGNSDDGKYSGEDIYKYLKVDDLYRDYYTPDNIDEFFLLSEEEMKDKVSHLSRGMKDLISLIAVDKVEGGEIDSMSKIKSLESALGIKLNKEEG